MVSRWDLVVADFASEYGIRLGRGERPSWREFRSLLVGLMAADTRLSRHFVSLDSDDYAQEGADDG